MDYTSFLISAVALCCLMETGRAEDQCVQANCRATTGLECNGRGTCDCGTCRCEGLHHGPTCEECPTCRSPCDVFAECVSCKVYETGTLGFFRCMEVCGSMATFYSLGTAEFEAIGADVEMELCERVNELDCRETFKIGGMKDGYRDLFVKADMDCEDPDIGIWDILYREIPTTTTTEKPTTTTKATTAKPTTQTPSKTTTMKITNIPETTENLAKSKTSETVTGRPSTRTSGKAEKAGAVSGTSEVSEDPNNGASGCGFEFSVILCLWIVSVLL